MDVSIVVDRALTTDVGAAAEGNIQVKVVAGAAGVLAQEALCIGLRQRLLDNAPLVVVLPPVQ